MFKRNIFLICTSLIMLLIFTGCGASDVIEPNVVEVMTEISNSLTFPEMVDINIDRIDDYYEVDVTKIKNSQLIMAGSGFTPEEILVVEFIDKETADDFKSKMDNRLKQINSLFENYGSPESGDYIANCKMVVKNQYAFFAICEDSDTALKIFNDSFNA